MLTFLRPNRVVYASQQWLIKNSRGSENQFHFPLQFTLGCCPYLHHTKLKWVQRATTRNTQGSVAEILKVSHSKAHQNKAMIWNEIPLYIHWVYTAKQQAELLVPHTWTDGLEWSPGCAASDASGLLCAISVWPLTEVGQGAPLSRLSWRGAK